LVKTSRSTLHTILYST